MTILAIDPSSTSLGYAVWTSRGDSWTGAKPVKDGYMEPDKTSPRHTLESIEAFVLPFLPHEGIGGSTAVDAVACEQMFLVGFQGDRTALLSVIPKQIEYLCREAGIPFVLVNVGAVKKAVGANALQKLQPKLKTKQAVYASVERYMSDEAKALPLSHRLDVSDAHAVALTAIKKLAEGTAAPSPTKAKRATKKT